MFSRVGMIAAALVAAFSVGACASLSRAGGAADSGSSWLSHLIPKAIVLALAVGLLFGAPAFAQDGTVTVPWGDWLALILANMRDIVIAGVAAFIAWIAKRLSPAIADVILAARVEQLLSRAIDYGIAAVAGATKGKTLDVRVTNQVLEAAAEYAVANAPSLAGKLGDTLRPKLLARLADNVDSGVSAPAVDAEVKP